MLKNQLGGTYIFGNPSTFVKASTLLMYTLISKVFIYLCHHVVVIASQIIILIHYQQFLPASSLEYDIPNQLVQQ